MYGLQDEEFLDSVRSELPAVAGLLHAAEGGPEVERGTVDLYLASAEQARDPLRPAGVTRPDTGREPVAGVVGDAHRMGFAVVGDDSQDRAEDLLARDRHGVVDAGEDGRLHVVPAGQPVRWCRAAGHERGALGDAELDVAAYPVALGSRNQRAKSGAALIRVSDHGGLGGRAGDLGGAVMPVAGYEHAGMRGAALPAVTEAVPDHLRDNRRQVGVIQDDGGGLAAEFQGHRLDRGGRELADPAAGSRGTGEADHVHAAVRGQRLPSLRARPGDHVDNTGNKP